MKEKKELKALEKIDSNKLMGIHYICKATRVIYRVLEHYKENDVYYIVLLCTKDSSIKVKVDLDSFLKGYKRTLD